MRKGLAALGLLNPALDHPVREGCGRGGGVGTFQEQDRGAQPGRHALGWARCAGRAAGGEGERARLACAVCLPRRAGSTLFTGESRPDLFLAGLSQVAESIKPPDRGKGRQSAARRAPGERRPRPGPPGPAMPALWLGCCLCVALLLPAGRATSGREGEWLPPQPWAGDLPFSADRDG